MKIFNQIYNCKVCNNLIEIINPANGELYCCKKSMQLMIENTEEAALEKHIPIVIKQNNKIIVTVGDVLHPMEEIHYIEWIELVTDKKVYRKRLEPKDEPTVEFDILNEKYSVRAYCNLHGLWRNK